MPVCDVMALKEEDALRETGVMNAIHLYDKCGLTQQPVAMSNLNNLVCRREDRIHVLILCLLKPPIYLHIYRSLPNPLGNRLNDALHS